jgi:hypothetical protein
MKRSIASKPPVFNRRLVYEKTDSKSVLLVVVPASAGFCRYTTPVPLYQYAIVDFQDGSGKALVKPEK